MNISVAAAPSARIEQEEILNTLYREMERLTKRQRRVLLEHYFEGRTFKQIGRQTGVSGSAAQSACRTALARLRRPSVCRRLMEAGCVS